MKEYRITITGDLFHLITIPLVFLLTLFLVAYILGAYNEWKRAGKEKEAPTFEFEKQPNKL